MHRPDDERPWPEAQLDGPFDVERTPERDRVVIHMIRARKDWFQIIFLIVFWLIWTPVTVFAVLLIIRHFSWGLVLWLVFGVVGVLLIPLALLGAFGRELIEIDDDMLVVRRVPRGLPLGRCGRDRIEALTLECHQSGPGVDAETVMTLNVIRTGSFRQRRISIGQLLHLDRKAELLGILVPLLRERGWQFDVRDTRPAPAVSSSRPDSRASEPNHGG